MESAHVSSQEKLDQLLHNGKITQQDYQRLSQVMAGPSGQFTVDKAAGTQRGKFRKSWENGMIGGLCAGYAKHFGVDQLVVRTVLIVACVLLSALNGVGLALIPLYFALCAFVPWDEDERAKAFILSGHPRLFVVAVACLFVVLPLLYSVLILPELESIYSDMGTEVWSGEFQRTLAGRAIDGASEYRYWLQLNDGVIFLGVGIAAAMMSEVTKAMMPIMQKQMQGITFYSMLQPENDPHYVGGGVKLGTPDCPILWYKPTGADKYRVIYADLSVKDMTPDDVKKLPEARPK